MLKNLNWASGTRLMVGLMLYGLALSLIVQARLGVPPWDVLAQGLAKTFHLQFGTGIILVSAIVMLAWIPLKQKPGVGSIANAVLIGVWANFFLTWLKPGENYLISALMFLAGMILVALATGIYISADLGAGPRDGLMIGTSRRFERPLWVVRTGYELIALACGWALGGQFREGTVVFALGIGYLMQHSIRIFKARNR